MPVKQSPYQIVIPARYASERLPGKMLLKLAGIPLLQHVWQRATESSAKSVVTQPMMSASLAQPKHSVQRSC